MIKISTPLCYFFLLFSLVLPYNTKAQDVGIGTLSPDHTLHVAGNTSTLLKLDNTSALNTGVMSELYFKTGTHYTGALKTIGNGTVTARLGLFTYAVINPTALIERMSIMDNGNVGIGTNNPGFLLDINGRMRVRHGGSNNTAGIHFMDAANMVNAGFIGMKDDNTIGLYGGNGGGWGLTMSTTSGDVSIVGSQLYATSSESYTGYFGNFSGSGAAVEAVSENVGGGGIGLEAQGGAYGVYAIADEFGVSHRYGVYASGRHGDGNNYGVYATSFSGNNAYGIYATASGGSSSNWAGYFSGNVYSSGSYQGSDRKLKSDIQPMNNAVQLIKALKPSIYLYKTSEYGQMQLPEGKQYGLIADEVKQVFPSMVKQVVQPAKFENDDRSTGRMLADEVTFEAVNYTAMIPVLIAAMQEQQAMIEAQQRRIEELEAKIK
jgi:hypothetical protein